MSNQFTRILTLCKANSNKEVDCATLARFGLFHKAASRLGAEARRKGYVFERIEGTDWSTAKYRLTQEPIEPVKYEYEENGQMMFKVA